MIIPEKPKTRTAIENMLLKEMVDEDTMEIALESDAAAYIDDMSTDTGLFGNTSSSDGLFDDGDDGIDVDENMFDEELF